MAHREGVTSCISRRIIKQDKKQMYMPHVHVHVVCVIKNIVSTNVAGNIYMYMYIPTMYKYMYMIVLYVRSLLTDT